jgi:hypothetical protein
MRGTVKSIRTDDEETISILRMDLKKKDKEVKDFYLAHNSSEIV